MEKINLRNISKEGDLVLLVDGILLQVKKYTKVGSISPFTFFFGSDLHSAQRQWVPGPNILALNKSVMKTKSKD